MNRRFFLDNLWRWKVGLPEITGVRELNFDGLKASEWSREFERLMRDRLVVGALRYGLIGAPDKPVYDRLGAIEEKLKEYRLTGNDELLVEIATGAMCEFVEGTHPKKHFAAGDDTKHLEVKR
jgi:hypothetical protein